MVEDQNEIGVIFFFFFLETGVNFFLPIECNVRSFLGSLTETSVCL